MALDVPTEAPTCVPLLSRMEWERTFSEFATDWTVSVHFNGPSAADGFDVAATDAGSGLFRFSVDSGAGQLDELGRWNWQVWAAHASEGRRVLEVGTFELVAGYFEGDAAIVTSTHSSRMLAIIEARLEGRIPRDAESYSIGGRSLSRIPITELLDLRRRYRVERNAELRALEAGVRPGRRRRLAFGF